MLKSDFCTLIDYATDKELTDVGECPMDSVGVDGIALGLYSL